MAPEKEMEIVDRQTNEPWSPVLSLAVGSAAGFFVFLGWLLWIAFGR